MAKIINGAPLPNIPWQDRPAGCDDVVWRYDANPIIPRNPAKGCARVFNSAVVPWGDEYIGVFRADHTVVTPALHVGHSKDGINWEIDPTPIDWRDENGEPFASTYYYDPRVTWLEDAYYIVWCTDDHGPVLGLGKTNDFKSFTRLPNTTLPFNRNGVPFPRKVNGKYLMLNRPSDDGHTPFGNIWLSESPDLVYWGKHKLVMARGTDLWWESTKIGAGNVPIETDEGWLVFYHGVVNTCNGFVYSFGAVLLDLEDPSKVLYRGKEYLITPEKDYETTGFVPNVCFPCATLVDADTGRIAIYYGAADTYVALAFTTVDDVVKYLKENHQ
ncbi:MAG: glycoside hydrolase family 130 protein [Clostridia bacterium]|nr:glycoside hydrolase family 130 protein [Clostridia bacterium]